MTRSSARESSPLAADCPMARPSAKLCRPIPTAISNASWRAGDHVDIRLGRALTSLARMAPGPWRPSSSSAVCDRGDCRAIQLS